MTIKPIGQKEQSEVQMEGAVGARMRMLIGPGECAGNFHMRHFELAPGGHAPHHQHDYEHEILVLAGQGSALGAAGQRTFSAGDCIWVPPPTNPTNSATPVQPRSSSYV